MNSPVTTSTQMQNPRRVKATCCLRGGLVCSAYLRRMGYGVPEASNALRGRCFNESAGGNRSL